MSSETLEKRFTDLQDRLAVLQDATNQLKELIDRLANFDFQPGSVPIGAGDDDNVGSELSSEINQILREQEEELELLQEEIIDIRPGRPSGNLQHDKDRLKDGADRLGRELQSCRKAFRRAQISAKRNLQQAQRQERQLLYASFSHPRSGASSPAAAEAPLPSRRKPRQRAEMSKEEQMISASSDVTESMRRTHDLMAAELTKSDFAHNTLKESTASLSQLSENYSSLDTLLSNSRALLGTLLKSQKTDTWYLQSAFYLLVVTISWLVFRRWLWGPTWWLVWLPLKLVFRSVVGVSNTVARRGVGSGSDSATVQSMSQLAQMNNEGVPTVQVVQSSQNPQESSESVMGEVNKIINGTESASAEEHPKENDTEENTQEDQQEETVLRERNDDELPNPKKRMMEEDASNQQGSSNDGERVKDEL